MAQIRHATDDRVLLGSSLYSYAIPVAGDRNAFLDRLRRELWADSAPAPSFSWKTQPETGYILGRITAGNAPLVNASLYLVGPGGAERWVTSDGSGVFGDVNLTPGTWTVAIRNAQTNEQHAESTTVAPGKVSHISLNTAAPTTEALVPAEPDRAFGELWNRTDRAVAEGQTGQSWMWGPGSFGTASEAYSESPGGRRTVQYWDKSRMEVTNTGGNREDLWFVTNGLLTKELISGKLQVGPSEFVERQPSNIPVVGDPTGAAPRYTYGSFGGVASLDGDRRVPSAVGAQVVQTIDEHGNVGSDANFGRYNVVNAEYNNDLGHNVPNVFQSYLTGMSLPWVFVMGFPITEAYWTQASVGGEMKNVLVQLYERRTLTFTPSNPEAFRVEMGNVGQHYYRWRYSDAPWER